MNWWRWCGRRNSTAWLKMLRAQVIVGQMVAIREEEAVALEDAAGTMLEAAFHKAPGWFGRYLHAHRAAHKVCAGIFKRSHATPDTPHGADPRL